MVNTTPQTSYDLDTRLLSINSLAQTAIGTGDASRVNRLFELAFNLLDPKQSKAEPPEVKEKQRGINTCKCMYCFPFIPPAKGPDVCDDPGCGICHPWNKEVE